MVYAALPAPTAKDESISTRQGNIQRPRPHWTRSDRASRIFIDMSNDSRGKHDKLFRYMFRMETGKRLDLKDTDRQSSHQRPRPHTTASPLHMER